MPYFTMMGSDVFYLILLFGVMMLGVAAQSHVHRVFNKYSKVSSDGGRTAGDVALELLRDSGSSVTLTQVPGTLTDHFNPKTGTLGLSQSVYPSSSLAALAVAAHEVGHVMQYQEGYGPIRIRNAILPVAQFGSQASVLIVILGLFMGSFDLAIAGVVLFGAVLLFQLVTLPVEFNASARAMELLSARGYITYDEMAGARRVLRAASMTYVVAALASAVTLLRLLSLAQGSRRR